MPHVSPEARLARAAELRKQAKQCTSAVARLAFNLAADRLEVLAAKAVRKIGRRVTRRAGR